jgi:hypothetical protein
MATLDSLVRTLYIRTKDMTVEPFVPNWAQREMIDKIEQQMKDSKPVRIVVLKARQLGISTLTEGLMFLRSFIYENSGGLVLAHEQEASDYLLQMTHLYWDTWPYKPLYTTKYAGRRELHWVETNSSIRVATARNVGAGRSRTLHAVHASEVAFWDQPEKLMLGMRQTIPNKPGSFIVLESTANGVGNWFYDTWNAAEQGEVEYEPLFFPWFKHPDYKASAIGLPVPSVMSYDAEERLLVKLGADDDSLTWRRWAIRNLADGDEMQFHQEYPSTPEEAFVASGTNVFPIGKLKDCYEPQEGIRGLLVREGTGVRFVPEPSGPLRVFRMPSNDSSWGHYFVAGDPTHTTFGDNACAQVINRRTYEQVAVFKQKIDPMTFAEELAKLGTFYNSAELVSEVEGPGYATIGHLVALDYPHIWRNRWADKSPGKLTETMCWSTTWKRKNWAIGWLLKLIVDGDIKIHDRQTFDEMRNYVTMDNGEYGPADNKGHDDHVMALAIAAICSSTDGPLMAYDGGEKFRAAREELEPTPSWEAWGA